MKIRRNTPAPDPAWHYDFRDMTALPDVKVVRTSFFINGISVFVLLVVALYLAVQEFKRHTLKEEMDGLRTKIEENSSRNAEVLKLHGAFKAEERYINGVFNYLDGSLELSSLLVALADALHEEMVFTTIRYQNRNIRGDGGGKELVVQGTIRATPDAAASVVTDYVDSLVGNPFLAGRVKEAVPTSLVPTPEGDKMSFGIRVILSKAVEKEKDEK